MSLPPSFWPNALNSATYLLNILPSKLLHHLTPTHLLYHQTPSYTRVFGCLCFPLFPATTIHKLQPRSSPCVFLGYPSSHRGYKCYDISSNKIIISRHVLFDESTFPFSRSTPPRYQDYAFYEEGSPLAILTDNAQPTYTNPPCSSPPPCHGSMSGPVTQPTETPRPLPLLEYHPPSPSSGPAPSPIPTSPPQHSPVSSPNTPTHPSTLIPHSPKFTF